MMKDFLFLILAIVIVLVGVFTVIDLFVKSSSPSQVYIQHLEESRVTCFLYRRGISCIPDKDLGI